MADQSPSAETLDLSAPTPFEELLSTADGQFTFTTAFRGYDRDEVDASIRSLTARMDEAAAQITELTQYKRLAGTAVKQSKEKIERLEAMLVAANDATEAAGTDQDDEVARLKGELTAANAQLAEAQKQIQTLSDELVAAPAEGVSRPQFDEVLRVAEDQATSIIQNATLHGERLLQGARNEAAKMRVDAQAEADAMRQQAQHDAQQMRLRTETEQTAHEARIEREAAHAAEQVSQAEREAAAIRSEAEKGAAALRSLVTRETTQQRAEAEEAMRELQMRSMDFEASLTRRQDDAQQEFLTLHNQAVAHADRITKDANQQVTAALEHAQRVSAKADDFERLMRAQAQQIEADATVRAQAKLEAARARAQHILDLVSAHSQSVLRDAEDRTRQLRWQQHELTSFMAEVKELMRGPQTSDAASDVSDDDLAAELAALAAQAEDVVAVAEAVIDEGAESDAAEQQAHDGADADDAGNPFDTGDSYDTGNDDDTGNSSGEADSVEEVAEDEHPIESEQQGEQAEGEQQGEQAEHQAEHSGY